MNLFPNWKHALLLAALACAQTAAAVTPGEEPEKKCIKPKFRDFSPENLAEVAPGGEISFHINRHADPLHVGASAKQIPLKVQVTDKQTFYYVTAKLPAELTSGFARITIEARAMEGECVGRDGWLVKIVGPESASGGDKSEAAASEPEKKP